VGKSSIGLSGWDYDGACSFVSRDRFLKKNPGNDSDDEATDDNTLQCNKYICIAHSDLLSSRTEGAVGVEG